tara:strand:+ start:2432 stop:2698 length:267 start_codon:yes stop_codon:yes gene_type:complete
MAIFRKLCLTALLIPFSVVFADSLHSNVDGNVSTSVDSTVGANVDSMGNPSVDSTVGANVDSMGNPSVDSTVGGTQQLENDTDTSMDN